MLITPILLIFNRKLAARLVARRLETFRIVFPTRKALIRNLLLSEVELNWKSFSNRKLKATSTNLKRFVRQTDSREVTSHKECDDEEESMATNNLLYELLSIML